MNEYVPATPMSDAEVGETFTIDITPDQSVQGLKNQLAWAFANIESWKKQWDKARDYLQASINREEWEQSELAEPFWEELAEMFNLDLKRTKEIEIRVTLTYSGTVTVPYDCDAESDLDIEGLSDQITVNYGGVEIEDQWVTFEGQEVEEY